MDASNNLSITNIPAISAIYFALLQCGYDFYGIRRDASLIETLQRFILDSPEDFNFFSGVRQTTCEAYPYWPRAAMLETASFYITPNTRQFHRFDAFRDFILSAPNLLDRERDAAFWAWITDFPAALAQVMAHRAFQHYLEWERTWTAQQTVAHQEELLQLQALFNACKLTYYTPITDIQIVLNPIKCVFSADYHQVSSTLIVSAGAFHADTVIHEFLHPIVHPIIEQHRADLLSRPVSAMGLDASYSLDGNFAGRLNALEESMVRKLTDEILSGHLPKDLDYFLTTLYSE